MGEMRRYVRSTAAHNTVRVDGEEQSEIWGAFRLGRRARLQGASLEHDGEALRFRGSHDGYRRLGVTHERRIEFQPGAGWTVRDLVTGRGRHHVESFVHLHPDFRVEARGREIDVLVKASGARYAGIHVGEGANMAIEKGSYCPEFGRRIENDVVVLSSDCELPMEISYTIGR
jgi:uncharacterized heparinase superfamily protein